MIVKLDSVVANSKLLWSRRIICDCIASYSRSNVDIWNLLLFVKWQLKVDPVDWIVYCFQVIYPAEMNTSFNTWFYS